MGNQVCVILPIYQADKEAYIRLAIESVLQQTYEGGVSLLIGVDGPVSNESAICLKEYEQRDDVNIQWYPENRGLAVVLNNLLDICFSHGYEYIARMDADDISLPNRIEKQMAFLALHPDIDVVGGSIEEIDENGESRGKVIVYPETPDGCYKFFSRRNPHAHPAVLFRRSFFDKARCKYRSEYRKNQDTMLWLDGLKAGTKHANIPDVILKYRLTNSLFKNRRSGWAFAEKQLQDRNMINKTLGYGMSATIFGYLMFVLMISPAWVKAIAYRWFR